MTLVKLKNNMNPANRWVNNPFDAFSENDFSRAIRNEDFRYMPPVNVKEGKEDFQLELVAPGRNKNDFNIKIDNNQLTISSKIEKREDEANEKWTRKEYSYASFSRSFSLPEYVDGSNISAQYMDGVLKVSIPKKEQAKEKPSREITVS
jgi:HSP20 family protein